MEAIRLLTPKAAAACKNFSKTVVKYFRSHANIGRCLDPDKKTLLTSILELEHIDRNEYRSSELLPGRTTMDAVYGGQVVGHALNAASSTVDSIFQPHSLHCYFIKLGTVKNSIKYSVERIRDGRSFCTRSVKAIQNSEIIFTAQVSFHKQEPDSIKHSYSMPNVIEPENLKDLDVFLKDILQDHSLPLDKVKRSAIQRRLSDPSPALWNILEARPVNGEQFLFQELSTIGGFHYHVWIKSKQSLGDNYCLQRCLAAYMSDSLMMETPMFPHINLKFFPSMVFSLDHSVWFHKPNFHVDQWMLVEVNSSCAAGSRAFSTARVWTRNGTLVMSVAQEGLIRSRL